MTMISTLPGIAALIAVVPLFARATKDENDHHRRKMAVIGTVTSILVALVVALSADHAALTLWIGVEADLGLKLA